MTQRRKSGSSELGSVWINSLNRANLILICEFVLTALIILRVPYTEIDWMAYMQECEGWLAGQLDYTQLRGDTGPLVYPAGFVYIFSCLRWISGGGKDPAGIRTAQWIFMGVYLLTQATVLHVYNRARVKPVWIVLLLLLSKRLHSLFVLRLFNDCIAMCIAYGFVAAFIARRWLVGSILFSLALSVKMNVLLFLPGFVFIIVRNAGLSKAALYLFLIVVIQVLIGLPFLMEYPISYLTRAFEFSRVFQYKWTVNLKFLSEDVFVSKSLATGLLTGHLVSLVLLAHFRWCYKDGGLFVVAKKILMGWRNFNKSYFYDDPSAISFILLSSNFVGIVFSRTLHYQFYTWYFHALPLLLWRTSLPSVVRVAVLLAIEFGFNIGDADGAGSALSSMTLQIAHFTCLIGLLIGRD